jgi:hypothetical protein
MKRGDIYLVSLAGVHMRPRSRGRRFSGTRIWISLEPTLRKLSECVRSRWDVVAAIVFFVKRNKAQCVSCNAVPG